MKNSKESLERLFKESNRDFGWEREEQHRMDKETIEKDLDRLEEIDTIIGNGGGIWAENGIVSKKLKALEIIKNKCSPLLKQYLLDLLSKEECELLKEVLL